MESFTPYPTSSFLGRTFHWNSNKQQPDPTTIKTPDYFTSNHNNRRRAYSRSRTQISKGNIQNWIENVEKSVFDDGTIGQVLSHLPSQQKYSRMSLAQMTLDQLRHHDEAQQEAEDLLNDWAQKTLYEPNVLTDDLDEFINESNKSKITKKSSEFSLSVDFDEDEAVDAVVQKMLQKKVIPKKIQKELGLESLKQVDPRVKMELRRKQVRENRMMREREAEKKHQEMLLKKEARIKAQQKIMEEEKLKTIRKRQEEYEIQKEMALIRKQMKDEKKKAEDKKKRESQNAAKLSPVSEPKICVKECFGVEETIDIYRKKQEQERQEAAKMEALKLREKTLKLKILHRHFCAWYALILQQRLCIGKACALLDWRLLHRCWNTWRSMTNRQLIDKELLIHQQDLKDNQRKDKKASVHYSSHLLQKYFLTWQLFVLGEKERRKLEENQLETKKKMKALLDFASSAQLKESENTAKKISTVETEDLNKIEQTPSMDKDFSEREKIEKIEQSPTKTPLSKNRAKQNTMPNEHWKIRKSLVHMKPSRMAAMLGVDYLKEKKSTKNSCGASASPLMMSTIERQLDTQKKLVKDQQKQLKEQKRMIEQLQIDQRRQQLQNEEQILLNQLHKKEKRVSRSELKEKKPSPRRNSISEPEGSSSPKRKQMKDHDQPQNSPFQRSKSVDYINSKHAQILKKMEARAAERKKIKEEREARKQQKEEEKLAILKAAEEERLKQEEEEKKARVKARQEQKRLEQQREVERQKKLAEMQRLNDEADNLRHFMLLKYKGILPWKKLVVISQNNHSRAVQHNSLTIIKKYFMAWFVHVEKTNNNRNEMAEMKYKQLLILRLFTHWKNYNNYTIILEQKADRFYANNLRFKIFKAWLSFSSEQTLVFWEKEEMAENYYKRQLQRRMLNIWRTFPEMKKKEKERQERRDKLRQKVALLLPDFELES